MVLRCGAGVGGRRPTAMLLMLVFRAMVALTATGILVITIQQTITTQDIDDINAVEDETDKDLSITQDRALLGHSDIPKQVLLLSSVGRSGSSWVGELMASGMGSHYLFEPELVIREGRHQPISEENTMPLISDLLNCRFDKDFLQWAQSQAPFEVFHNIPSMSVCRNNYNCDWRSSQRRASRHCHSATTRIIKSIRLRLSWTRKLLQEDSHKLLKVVYLLRDPRATLASTSALRWQTNSSAVCSDLMQDLTEFPKLAKEFPNQFILLRYEELCRNPKGEFLDLYRFLQGDPSASLQQTWQDYLNNHNTQPWWMKVLGPIFGSDFSTKRNSLVEAEAWRQEVDETTWRQVEDHCHNVIQVAGYNDFNSVNQLRDHKVPQIEFNKEDIFKLRNQLSDNKVPHIKLNKEDIYKIRKWIKT